MRTPSLFFFAFLKQALLPSNINRFVYSSIVIFI